MINDIRNYFVKLIKNTKNDDIKFFTNIELGTDFNNPHLHVQIWHIDQKQIDKIYAKVIDRFGLFSEFCKMTMPTTCKDVYNYVIKDYAKTLTDDELYKIDDAKRILRGVLGKKIRFSSHSKGLYTKSVYRSLYNKRGFGKDLVDELLDNCVIDVDGFIVSDKLKLFVLLVFTTFMTINRINREIECVKCDLNNFRYLVLFEWWVYGKLRNYCFS